MPNPKTMTPGERDRAIQTLEKSIELLRAAPVVTPCTKCLHFSSGHCHKWKAPVPPEAQPDGCTGWEEDIPF